MEELYDPHTEFQLSQQYMRAYNIWLDECMERGTITFNRDSGEYITNLSGLPHGDESCL